MKSYDPDLYNFNSHTREGVTEGESIDTGVTDISTHTPVRV